MPEQKSEAISDEFTVPNSQNEYSVSDNDLPLHCPMPQMSKWNSHPKVFIPVEDTGEAICPYCGTQYYLNQ